MEQQAEQPDGGPSVMTRDRETVDGDAHRACDVSVAEGVTAAVSALRRSAASEALRSQRYGAVD